ncbi:MAG: hypothetical protein JXB85_00385 [Anaerolineales bacterium]|nr:hypothetical protein [Anaerolineales bacterium]
MNEPLQVPPPTPEIVPQGSDKKGLAIAALVVGIISLCMAPIPLITLLAWPGSIVSIVLGALSLKSSGKTMAIIGLILGVLAMLLLIGMLIFNMLFAAPLLENLNL